MGRAILQRNIFDSSTGPLRWRRAAIPSPAPLQRDPVSTTIPPARCSRDIRLLVSIVVAGDPQRSMAMLRWQGESHLLQVGHALGEAQLLALRPARAYLQPSGQPVCELPLFLPASERVTPRVPGR